MRNQLIFGSKWKINRYPSSNCDQKQIRNSCRTCALHKWIKELLKKGIAVSKLRFEFGNFRFNVQRFTRFTYQISMFKGKFQSYKYGSSGVCLNIWLHLYWNHLSSSWISNSQSWIENYYSFLWSDNFPLFQLELTYIRIHLDFDLKIAVMNV